MTGECLSASGAINAMTCLLALNRRTLTHSVNLEYPLGIEPVRHLVESTTDESVDYCMANAASFGGSYASIVFGREPEGSMR
jgi:3-oxoacyl-(acyl-carrier-protein) synthase